MSKNPDLVVCRFRKCGNTLVLGASKSDDLNTEGLENWELPFITESNELELIKIN